MFPQVVDINHHIAKRIFSDYLKKFNQKCRTTWIYRPC